MNQSTIRVNNILCLTFYLSKVIVRYFVLSLALLVLVDTVTTFGNKGSTVGKISFVTAFVISILWIVIEVIRLKPILAYKLPKLRIFISSLAIDIVVLLFVGFSLYILGRIALDDILYQFLLMVFFACIYSIVFKLYQWRKVK